MAVGIGISALVIIYGVLTVVLKKSLLFGGNEQHFTKASIDKFAKFSGCIEVLIGAAILVFALSGSDSAEAIIRVTSAAVAWISTVMVVVLYLIVLVKKK